MFNVFWGKHFSWYSDKTIFSWRQILFHLFFYFFLTQEFFAVKIHFFIARKKCGKKKLFCYYIKKKFLSSETILMGKPNAISLKMQRPYFPQVLSLRSLLSEILLSGQEI